MYVEYETGERELYDVAFDPYQLQSKPRASNEQIYSDLIARLNTLRDCSGSLCRSAEGFSDTTPPSDPTPPDIDGDGVADAEDNCPEVANADQADADGQGDACDEAAPIDTTPTR